LSGLRSRLAEHLFHAQRETKNPFQKDVDGVLSNEGFDGVYVLQEPSQEKPLAPPSVRRIIQLKNLPGAHVSGRPGRGLQR
jgi:hypothetical protein